MAAWSQQQIAALVALAKAGQSRYGQNRSDVEFYRAAFACMGYPSGFGDIFFNNFPVGDQWNPSADFSDVVANGLIKLADPMQGYHPTLWG